MARYRIEGVLGSGGMGTVYMARHPTLPRSDALKVLSAELSHDDEFRARFIREADLAATLNHPNVVTVYDRGQTEEGQLWIAMEYVDGMPADQLAGANRTPARIVRVITDVAKALDYAHSRRVLHRDIKPANFLIAGPGSGDNERTLLADFGIARALDDATNLTATGSLMATASYAPPEAVEGHQVDHRADIYSLGCSLFRLLTGRTPYEGTHGSAGMLMAHVLQPIPRPTDAVPGLPPAIDDVIARAMAKDPADRFQTAGALAAATAAALTGGPSAPLPDKGGVTRAWATPPPHTAPTQRPAEPAPTLQTAAPMRPFPAGPPPAPPHLPPHSGPPPAPMVPAPPPPRRRKRGRIAGAAVLAVLVAVAAVVGVLVLRHQGGGPAPYQPQTLQGGYGPVALKNRPVAIAALGPGDPDAVLSLGVQPVLIGGIQSAPKWLQSMVHSSAQVLAAPDSAALASVKPDLIIDTGNVDQPTYSKLSAIAPTLTRPADTSADWVWQTQLNWIATALGRSDAAKTLLEDATSQQTKVKSQHPAFNGRSITVVNYSDTAATVATRVSAPTNYLEGIGFAYNGAFRRNSPNDPATVPLDQSAVDHLGSVVLLLRTDKAAGGGGYGGLPAVFTSYSGILVIVDDPATITALNTGGPAANTYLNGALVTKLAAQVH